MKNSLLILALSSAALFGCEKDDDDNNQQSEKTTFLVQSAWRFDNAGIDVDRNGTIETALPAGSLESCFTDNTITFSANGNGMVDEGPTKCDAADPQTTPFTWSFAANETAMNISGDVVAGIEGGQFKIIALTSTKLSLSKDTSILGAPVALIAEFKH